MDNRQVGVWRGTGTPPTNWHVWVKDDTSLYLYDTEKNKWVTFLEMPVLKLEQLSTGAVRIHSGEYYYDVKATGTGLDVFKNGNTLVFESSALTTIPTDDALNWDGKTLTHVKQNVEGTYGPSTSSGSSSFTVPKIKVNEYGHITEADQSTITVPAKVVQNPVSELGSYPVIVAGSPNQERETGEVNKASVTYEISQDNYGNKQEILNTPSLNVSGNSSFTGNLTVAAGYKIKGDVEGNVQGTATPTDHADKTTKYGAGTSAGEDGIVALYGHVKLQDEVPTKEPPKGNSIEGQGIAATPYLVYKAVQGVIAPPPKIETDEGKVEELPYDFIFTSDFKSVNNKIEINWLEV